ncbi:transmembrane signal receptor [Lithospermum erythrorhizon]|uniref:Transmembrane signal receptor n=1 Tax=Lithospermum erythrorhizon TaxID=34254 RepID=A0AAV3Q5K8_LITER
MAKLVTVRLVLALAASKTCQLFQLDINNAFLHGYLDEDIYMLPPEGYDKAVAPQVCKYGLKQASRQWNVEFTSTLLEYGFNQSYHDNCLFTFTTMIYFLVLVVYVDDILTTCTSEEEMVAVKQLLHKKFNIKNMGVAKYFLGIEIARSNDGMYLSQQKYVKDIIQDLKMDQAKAVATPLAHDWNVEDNNSPLLEDPSQYRRLVGRLLYLNFTRQDLTFSVHHLSQFMQHPTYCHWNVALDVVMYLKGTTNHGLYYPANTNMEITIFCDADWAKCTLIRRSITGYCIMIGGALIS